MKKSANQPEQEGDVLGISHATASIPRNNVGKGGHPEGIEIDTHKSGGSDVPQRSGATSIDMGAGGEGNAIKRER